MATSEKLFDTGAAASRGLASIADEYGIAVARAVEKAAKADRGTGRERNGTNVCFKSLTSAENVLRVAGASPERIPVLCKRLRSGSSARISLKAEGLDLKARFGRAPKPKSGDSPDAAEESAS